MGVIFVAGVHGVGKTTVCAHAVRSLGHAHYSASGLIKSEKANSMSETGKAVSDVDGNQALLIRGVEKACGQHQGRIILDGHFTLSKPDGRIEAVSVAVFSSLSLNGVVVYHDEPAAIVERLHRRDGERYRVDAIARHQDSELTHAQLVAAELGSPIEILPVFDSDALIATISRWWGLK
ncbi:MAG: AAA family ATPase [Chromatiaceae bacterium]|nr:AAA family ATPase [Chromatiaceae bacterium]